MQRLAVLTLLFATTLATSLGAQEINLPPQKKDCESLSRRLHLANPLSNQNLSVVP